jgi:hypothetical protein
VHQDELVAFRARLYVDCDAVEKLRDAVVQHEDVPALVRERGVARTGLVELGGQRVAIDFQADPGGA